MIYLWFAILSVAAALKGPMTNVLSTLFPNGIWMTNVNYIAVNSSDFKNTHLLEAKCDTIVQFQEVFCLGKSVNVTIANIEDPAINFKLAIRSNLPFDCSANLQTANEAITDSRYSHGEIRLPMGKYSISMKLLDRQNVLGYRGYAIRAATATDRLVIASRCRDKHRHNPNS